MSYTIRDIYVFCLKHGASIKDITIYFNQQRISIIEYINTQVKNGQTI